MKWAPGFRLSSNVVFKFSTESWSLILVSLLDRDQNFSWGVTKLGGLFTGVSLNDHSCDLFFKSVNPRYFLLFLQAGDIVYCLPPIDPPFSGQIQFFDPSSWGGMCLQYIQYLANAMRYNWRFSTALPDFWPIKEYHRYRICTNYGNLTHPKLFTGGGWSTPTKLEVHHHGWRIGGPAKTLGTSWVTNLFIFFHEGHPINLTYHLRYDDSDVCQCWDLRH